MQFPSHKCRYTDGANNEAVVTDPEVQPRWTLIDSPHQRPYSDGGRNSATTSNRCFFSLERDSGTAKHGRNSDESQRHVNPEDRLP